MPERIDDPQIEPGQRRSGFVGHGVQVGRVRDIAEPETQRRDITVLQQHRQSRDRAAIAIDGYAACRARSGAR